MAISQTFTMTVRNSDGILQGTSTYIASGDAVEEFSVVAPNGSDVTVPFTLDVSTVVSWWVVSDQEVTMEENPGQDFSTVLTANRPFFWIKDVLTGFGTTDPMGTVDATTLKFINAGGTNANVKGGFLTT